MASNRNTADAALKQKKEWSVPIWEDTEGYPVESDNDDIWKWEFLRRTEQYRDNWQQASKVGKAPNQEKNSVAKKQSSFLKPWLFDEVALARKYKISCAVPPHVHYTKLPKGFSFIRMPETTAGGDIIYPKGAIPSSDAYEKQKELSAKRKAASKNHEKPAQLTVEDLEALALKMELPPPTDWYEGRVWVEYDLGYALDAQLIHAENNLYKAQGQLGKFMELLGPCKDPDGNDYGPLRVGVKKQRGSDAKSDYKEMQKLLRIIDAKRCEVPNTKIARTLDTLGFKHMDDSTVSKCYQKALKLWHEL